MRRGLDGRTFSALKFRGLDNMALAGKVAEVWRQTGADALFVDAGGGAGVIDCLRQLNVPVAEIAFGGKADRPRFNARDELQPERKDDMKARGLSSPDIADALALAFAYEAAPRPEAAVGWWSMSVMCWGRGE